MRDDAGIVQLWTISPNGGSPRQWTHGLHDVTSAFTWSPDGKNIAHVMDHSICISSETETIRLTPQINEINEKNETELPLPYAVVFSPDGSKIAFLRHQYQANHIVVIETSLLPIYRPHRDGIFV
ncbi:MAG: DPP IV N-terminal domain-containing protein [Planctomycetaceae bacterium]|jgi:Tol biopolymer transport system component|nr:DPP IV N-terminal domain-containing protein [Planctomycetaceae bacterium]